MKKKKSNYAPQTKTILNFERKQAAQNMGLGLLIGIILGAILTQIGFFIGSLIN